MSAGFQSVDRNQSKTVDCSHKFLYVSPFQSKIIFQVSAQDKLMVLALTWKTGKSQEFANLFSRSRKSQEFYIKHEKVGKRPGIFFVVLTIRNCHSTVAIRENKPGPTFFSDSRVASYQIQSRQKYKVKKNYRHVILSLISYFSLYEQYIKILSPDHCPQMPNL